MEEDTLMQMPPRLTNITCITQDTFKLINKGLLVNNGRPDFARFQMLFNLVANKYGMDGHLDFLAKIFELCSYDIGCGLVFKWQNNGNRCCFLVNSW